MPRAQGCAGAACVSLAQRIRTNGYVQDERYIAIEHMDVRRDCVSLAQRIRMNGTPRAQGCAGAVPFSFARCLAQGGGESGYRSKGHDLLFSADYADYADYCMRVAYAMRRSGLCWSRR